MTSDERRVGPVVEREGEQAAPVATGCGPSASVVRESAELARPRVLE